MIVSRYFKIEGISDDLLCKGFTRRLFPAFLMLSMLMYFWLGSWMSTLAQNTPISASELRVIQSNLTPPSPDAAALEKFGDVPVGLYTGTPKIEIPLYQLKGAQLSLPISLQYHASGVRVEEIASSVGLGWSLMAGGSITRTVQGKPDESTWGYFQMASYFPQSTNWMPDSSFKIGVAENRRDSRPDLFSFNFAGKSGKFVFDAMGAVMTIPYYPFKIEHTAGFDTWKITDESGVQYWFEAEEQTLSSNTTGATETTQYFPSAWQLTKIQTPFGEDEIRLHYEQQGSRFDVRHTEQRFYRYPGQNFQICANNPSQIAVCPNKPPMSSTSDVFVMTQRLASIVSDRDSVLFLYEDDREDVQAGSRLSGLMIYRNGHFLREVEMQQSYFHNGQPLMLAKRLRLDRILFKRGNCPIQPPYKFEYYLPNALPTRNSFSQDHWGYYNGANNSSLVPQMYINLSFLAGGDREPNAASMLAASLKRITYPTGGYTDFEYEPHDYGHIAQTPVSDFGTISHTQTVTASQTGVIPVLHSANISLTHQQGVYLDFLCTSTHPDPLMILPESKVKLLDANGQVVWDTLYDYPGIQQQKWMQLAAGNYSIVAEAVMLGDSARLRVTYEEATGQVISTKIAGGLRIKRITSTDDWSDTHPIIKEYEYVLENEPNRSSGVLVQAPLYTYDSFDVREYGCPSSSGSGNPFDMPYECEYLVRSSSTQLSLGGKGRHIGYQEVIEKRDSAATIGYTRYTFTTAKDFPDQVHYSSHDDYPYPVLFQDWKRGLQLKKMGYDQSGMMVMKEETTYDFDETRRASQVYGAYIRYVKRYGGLNSFLSTIESYPYPIPTQWLHPKETKTVEYFASSDSILQLTKLFFDNSAHAKPTRMMRSRSCEGYEMVKNVYNKYYDYQSQVQPSSTHDQSLKSLQAMHVWDKVVEKQIWEHQLTDSSLISSQFVEYQTTNGGEVRPAAVWEYLPSKPVNDFTESHISQNATVKDTRYRKREIFDTYNDDGNLTAYHQAEDVPTAYLWGYDNRKVVATIRNASPEYAAYVGFEGENVGNWMISASTSSALEAATGDQYGNLNSGNLQISLPTQSYLVSYWAKNGSVSISPTPSQTRTGRTEADGWTYYEAEVLITNGNLQISGNAWIDEVRVYPADAQMETFVYDEYLRLMAIVDEKGVEQQFRYDGWDRLARELDDDKFIRASYRYHYQPDSQLVADFQVPNNATYNSTILFNVYQLCLPQQGVTNIQWDFGDGNTGSGISASHQYAAPGIYNVTLSLSHPNYQSDQITKSIEVGTNPLQVSFDNPTLSLNSGVNGGFSVTTTGGYGPYSYEWQVIDVANLIHNWQTIPNQSSNTISYGSSCDFALKCIVTDQSGNTSSTVWNVDVIPAAGQAACTY